MSPQVFRPTMTEAEEREWQKRLLAGAEVVGGERDPEYRGNSRGREVWTMNDAELAEWAVEVVKPLPVAEHGDVHTHWAGCRCEPCCDANRAYKRAWYAKRSR